MHKPKTIYLPPQRIYPQFTEIGIASWYGEDFHGKPTASGEIYNMYAMTAAHKTLPLGTYVRVTNLENGRRVVVKINDRGPFVKGRIIDLSYSAAKKLDMIKKGTAKVKIEVISTPVRIKNKRFIYRKYYAVQIGSFKIFSNAKNFKNYLKKYFVKVYVKKYKDFYRVLIGNYRNKTDAINILNRAEKKGYDGFIIEIDR